MHNNQHNQQLVLTALRSLMAKGTVINEEAIRFWEKYVNSTGTENIMDSSNGTIIRQIEALVDQLQPLKTSELEHLQDIFEQIPLDETTLQEMSARKNDTATNVFYVGQNIKVTDLAPPEQDFQDEYNFILSQKAQQRKYLVEISETDSSGYTIKYSNYLFGNFKLRHGKNVEGLVNLLTRSNIINSLLTSCGYISESEQCTSEQCQSFLSNLRRRNNGCKLKRNDGTGVAIIKVGSLILPSFLGTGLEKKLHQYLIYSATTNGVHLFLSYGGDISYNMLLVDSKYKDVVINHMLSEKNLKESQYIGSIQNFKLVKEPMPFGKAKFKTLKPASALT